MGDETVPVDLISKEQAELACTLGAEQLAERLDQWAELRRHVTARTRQSDGAVRVELDDRVDVGDLARLVAAERECCGFFSFALTVDDRGVGLEVRAPADAGPLIGVIVGS